MDDREAYEYYLDPEHLEPAGPGRKRRRPNKTTEKTAREEREIRGHRVVEALSQIGISTTYEERQFPLVSMHLEEAEKLTALIGALSVAAGPRLHEVEFPPEAH